MKYNRAANVYKASNVLFKVETTEAYSYDWWCFVKVIGGKVVFNRYNYSPTTLKHQYKVRRLLDDLGISIHLEIEAPRGLQRIELDQEVTEHYSSLIQELKDAIAKPRTHAHKNLERKKEIEVLAAKCVEFKFLTEVKNA